MSAEGTREARREVPTHVLVAVNYNPHSFLDVLPLHSQLTLGRDLFGTVLNYKDDWLAQLNCLDCDWPIRQSKIREE